MGLSQGFPQFETAGKNIVSKGLEFHVDAGDLNSYSGSGTVLTDTKGGITGVVSGSTSFGDSNHFSLNSGDGYIVLSDLSSKLLTLTSFSISLWFRYHDEGSGYQYLLSMGDNSQGWNVKKWHVSLNHDSNKFWWGSYGDATHANDNCGSAMTNNTIYNVVFNSDGILYNNGVSDATGKTNVGFDNCQTINYFNIGAVDFSSVTYESQRANARIYQMSIYNRVLPASEVADNFTLQRGRYGV